MSNLSPYRDGPFQLRYEAQQISLDLVKNSDGSATLKWNIPTPVFGCNPKSLAYDGFVIVVDNEPIRNEQKPVKGVTYTNDPTVSPELHAGDVINGAKVVVALYEDKTTSEYTVTGLEPKTPYYFAGFAVSSQLVYDTAGNHAYSVLVDKDQQSFDWPGYQEIRVLGQPNKKANIKTVVNKGTGTTLGQSSTKLDPNVEYTITIQTDLIECTELTFMGTFQTWDELIHEINRQIALIGNPQLSPTHPNLNSLFLDVRNERLFSWKGEQYDEESLIVKNHDPTLLGTGTYWYNETSKKLEQFDGTIWNNIEFTEFNKPINQLKSGDVWISVSQNIGAIHNGTTWCQEDLYVTSNDPSLAQTLPDGIHWYNPDDGFVYVRDSDQQCWKQVKVIYSVQDPSSLPEGALWYNYHTKEVYELRSDVWELLNVRFNVLPTKSTPANGDYWFNTTNDTLQRWNFATLQWIEVSPIHWPNDPRDRASCDRWWNADTNELFIWNALTNQWIRVQHFVHEGADPSLPPVLGKNTLWHSLDGTYKWDGMEWVEVNPILYESDPQLPILDTILKLPTEFVKWDGTDWQSFPVVQSKLDSTLEDGSYWYNPDDLTLKIRNHLNWEVVQYVLQPQVPAVGFQYYNTTLQKLLEWNNGRYVEAVPLAELYVNAYNNLMFVSKTKGSKSFAGISFDTAFKTAYPSTMSLDPVSGVDAISNEPMYRTQGVGTDGSEDERKEYANYVLTELGYPMVQVELTKQQIDNAITDAIEVLRMRTSAVYYRRFMAMDLFPDVQLYEFSNKSQHMDKVVRVNKVMRTRHGRIGAYSYNDPFGSSMIQQLYYAGSFDLLSYHLLASYNELINHMFANDVTFSWSEYTRTLQIHQVVRQKERVLVEVEIERTEQEILLDRTLRNWLKRHILGHCMITLGTGSRGKFVTLPGAGGGVTLNGPDLVTRGETLKAQCLQDIDDYVISGLDQYGSSSLVIMG